MKHHFGDKSCLSLATVHSAARGCLCLLVSLAANQFAHAEADHVMGPVAVLISSNLSRAYVACHEANQVTELDLKSGQVARCFPLPGPPSGQVFSPGQDALWITLDLPEGQVCRLSLDRGLITATVPVGHTPLSPCFSPDRKTLYVANRFDNSVSEINAVRGKERHRIPVLRQPVALVITPDGKRLLAANSLPAGRADTNQVAAAVTVIDAASARVIKQVSFPSGCGMFHGLCVSPDGRFAVVTHLLARYHLPTTQVDRGWMNANAISLIALDRLEWADTIMLDSVDSGAANPWGIAWSDDGKFLVVSHAGTHELSLIDAQGLLHKLADRKNRPDQQAADPGQPANSSPAYDDLSFLVGLRTRISLPGLGPRALTLTTNQAWVVNYFSDSVDAVRLNLSAPAVSSWTLGPSQSLSTVRRGELLFNDARLCFQGWQSCASCHSEDGRVDGFNWDLLNDGVGTPKNAKSLLLAHQTPPTMSVGIRESAEVAVRAGIRSVMFSEPNEADARAIDAYLKSLKPVPSPLLVRGQLSAAAERGRKVFLDPQVGCAVCHPPGLYTDTQLHNVGTRTERDGSAEEFDTPTLVEIWRTAPYLHDGSAADLREVLTTRNSRQHHGNTARLSRRQLEDLLQFLLSI
jgi:YVTN family beta-propeller protein